MTIFAPLAVPLLLTGLSLRRQLTTVTRFAPIIASSIVLVCGILLIVATVTG